MKTLIFTDLDGTLLHPKTYSFAEAMPALDLIRERNIALILCSSKTRAEVEEYRKRLENRDPFVVENGGAVFVPSGYFPFPTGGTRRGDYLVSELGKRYREIRKELLSLREKLGVRVKGFGDMSVEEVAGLTGLTLPEAALAKEREFSEPFVFEGPTEPLFLREIEQQGLHWTQGRFYHLMGDHDKGRAIAFLKQWFGAGHDKLNTIGLGDALNDLPLLKEVGHPVLVQNGEGGYDARVDLPGLIRANGIGPAGWNSAVLELLQP